jgi:hypothetical protein
MKHESVVLEVTQQLYKRLCAFGDANGIKEGESLVEFALNKAQPPLNETAQKVALFNRYKYLWSFRHRCFASEQERKIFSSEFVESSSIAKLQVALEMQSTIRWQFYFLEPPTPMVREQMIVAITADTEARAAL